MTSRVFGPLPLIRTRDGAGGAGCWRSWSGRFRYSSMSCRGRFKSQRELGVAALALRNSAEASAAGARAKSGAGSDEVLCRARQSLEDCSDGASSPNTTRYAGSWPTVMARGAKVRPRSANGFWMTPSCFSKRSASAGERSARNRRRTVTHLEMVCDCDRAQRRLAGPLSRSWMTSKRRPRAPDRTHSKATPRIDEEILRRRNAC